MNVEDKDEAPDLDIYVVNLHPSNIDINNTPNNIDEIKDRNNDIVYGDRTYSEQYLASVIADYAEFIKELKKSCSKSYQRRWWQKSIWEGDTEPQNKRSKNTSYTVGEQKIWRYSEADLRLIRWFVLNTNIIPIPALHKGGDITSKIIEEMIKEGESDALIELSH